MVYLTGKLNYVGDKLLRGKKTQSSYPKWVATLRYTQLLLLHLKFKFKARLFTEHFVVTV